MAENVLSNLYPPIVDTYMPAFIRTNKCKIYFSISSYNSYNDIRNNAQITVKNQNSNSSALNPNIYPNGIKICNVNIDTNVTTDDKYYVELDPSDLKNGFGLNQYYKIQIRFTNAAIPSPSAKNEGSWLAANTAFFSEWSRVCLIRGISQPKISVYTFETASDDASMTFTTNVVDFVGSLSFEEEGEEETLGSYRIRLYDEKNVMLSDSGDIYSSSYNNTNQINYTFKYNLIDGNSYKIVLDVTTRNLYTESKEYVFTVIQSGTDKLDATIAVNTDTERGCATIKLVGKTTNIFTGNITIRRTSSRTNFLIWEDVHTTVINEGKPLNYEWSDFSIESGIWYKYCVQKRNSLGHRGIALKYPVPIMVMFEDMFLVGDNTQLRIKYNPSVNSYKRTVADAKQDTIGSQYPFIKRSGHVNYRQFPIGGMITLFDDYLDTFSSREELMGGKDALELYEEYNSENRIGPFNDFIHEREFREKAMNFLYANKIRLFRTLSEGNILIRLMDINLTPETTLGRQIYSFTATAYEVDDCTIENIDKYGIQEIGDYSKLLSYDKSVLGQLTGSFKAGTSADIITKLLQDKYSKDAPTGFLSLVEQLTYLRLEFNMPPYLIKETSTGSLRKLNPLEQPDDTTVLGYIAYINNTAVLINPEGIYELKGEDISIKSLYFPIETQATIDYIVDLKEQEDVAHLAKLIYYSQKVGQIWGTFNYEESVFKRIWKKYRLNYNKYYQKLISVNGIKIEANPGTVVWVKESKDTDLERHVINENGSLQIYDEDSVIEGLYFSGYHLEPATEVELQGEQVPYNKFVETGLTYDDFDEIEKPIMNGVYTILKKGYGLVADEIPPEEIETPPEETESVELPPDKNYALLFEKTIDSCNRYIWHEGQWKLFTDDNDILCNVDGMIDYFCEIMKGVYAR